MVLSLVALHQLILQTLNLPCSQDVLSIVLCGDSLQ